MRSARTTESPGRCAAGAVDCAGPVADRAVALPARMALPAVAHSPLNDRLRSAEMMPSVRWRSFTHSTAPTTALQFVGSRSALAADVELRRSYRTVSASRMRVRSAKREARAYETQRNRSLRPRTRRGPRSAKREPTNKNVVVGAVERVNDRQLRQTRRRCALRRSFKGLWSTAEHRESHRLRRGSGRPQARHDPQLSRRTEGAIHQILNSFRNEPHRVITDARCNLPCIFILDRSRGPARARRSID
jgi:hypothetical protein